MSATVVGTTSAARYTTSTAMTWSTVLREPAPTLGGLCRRAGGHQ